MTLFMFVFLRDKSRSQYDVERQRTILSEMRASYENQIAKLVMDMTATQERWRDANHLLLSGQTLQSRRDPHDLYLTGFLRDMGLTEKDIVIEPKLIFVLTPFSDEEQHTYEAIKNVCNRNGLRCARGDEEFTRGDILSQIIRIMVRARVVIANIGTRNPNVMYELGIAQAIRKQTILISKSLADMPFEIKNMRIVVYKDDVDLQSELTNSLLRAMAETQIG
jgi:hypothetical protein